MSVICALAVVGVAPVAFAQQDPAREGYSELPSPKVLPEEEGPPPSVAPDSESSPPDDAPSEDSPAAVASDSDSGDDSTQEAAADTLPFTGLDVAIVALMGAALIATGVAMRRSVRRS